MSARTSITVLALAAALSAVPATAAALAAPAHPGRPATTGAAAVVAGSTVSVALQLPRHAPVPAARPAGPGHAAAGPARSNRSDGMLVPVFAATVIALVLLAEYGADRRRRGGSPVPVTIRPAAGGPAAGHGAEAQPRRFVVPHALLEQIERDKLSGTSAGRSAVR